MPSKMCLLRLSDKQPGTTKGPHEVLTAPRFQEEKSNSDPWDLLLHAAQALKCGSPARQVGAKDMRAFLIHPQQVPQMTMSSRKRCSTRHASGATGTKSSKNAPSLITWQPSQPRAETPLLWNKPVCPGEHDGF